jgi:hypothetical protein
MAESFESWLTRLIEDANKQPNALKARQFVNQSVANSPYANLGRTGIVDMALTSNMSTIPEGRYSNDSILPGKGKVEGRDLTNQYPSLKPEDATKAYTRGWKPEHANMVYAPEKGLGRVSPTTPNMSMRQDTSSNYAGKLADSPISDIRGRIVDDTKLGAGGTPKEGIYKQLETKWSENPASTAWKPGGTQSDALSNKFRMEQGRAPNLPGKAPFSMPASPEAVNSGRNTMARGIQSPEAMNRMQDQVMKMTPEQLAEYQRMQARPGQQFRGGNSIGEGLGRGGGGGMGNPGQRIWPGGPGKLLSN